MEIKPNTAYKIVKNDEHCKANLIGCIVRYIEPQNEETGDAIGIFTISRLPENYPDGLNQFFKVGSRIFCYEGMLEIAEPDTITIVISPKLFYEITLADEFVKPLNPIQTAAVADILEKMSTTICDLVLYETIHGHILTVDNIPNRVCSELLQTMAKRETRWFECDGNSMTIGLTRGL